MVMRWWKMAMVGLVALIAFGGTLLIAQNGPTPVDALELDDDAARREDDGADLEVNEDDGDDDGRDDTGEPGQPGTAGTNTRAADATDDRRDGTRDGDTSHGRGTGTGVSAVGAVSADTGGDTNAGGNANTGANSNTGGNDT
jgi:hypothetical protein